MFFYYNQYDEKYENVFPSYDLIYEYDEEGNKYPTFYRYD